MQPAALIIGAPLMLVMALLVAGHLIAAAQTSAVVCGDAQMQDQVRAAMYIALDQAFQQHVASLYGVMLKEHNRSSAERAKAGVDLAVGAYLHGYKAVDNWRLSPCR